MSAEARREQLLDAAKAAVAEHGFHGVSIEAVARGAGVTRPIVYRHFQDLGAVLDALIERETLRALMQLREVLPAGVDDLISAFEGYLSAVRSDPVTWRLVLVTPEGAPALLRERIAAGQARRMALPGHARAIVVFDAGQYPLGRALLAEHPEAELWYGGHAGSEDLHEAAGARAALRFGAEPEGPVRERNRPLYERMEQLGVESGRLGSERADGLS